MEKKSYSPRFIIIFLMALLVGQVMTVNYLKNDFQDRITECYQAINTNSILQGAIVNILVEKKILDRSQLINEAKNLSLNLDDIIKNMKASEEAGAGVNESLVDQTLKTDADRP
jgi:hypothetical protein